MAKKSDEIQRDIDKMIRELGNDGAWPQMPGTDGMGEGSSMLAPQMERPIPQAQPESRDIVGASPTGEDSAETLAEGLDTQKSMLMELQSIHELLIDIDEKLSGE